MTNTIMSFSTKLLATITFTLATCTSIICSAACDWIEPGECLGPGEMFGPCDLNLPAGCNAGLTCHQADKGDICLPGAVAADDFEAATCAAWRGTMACSKDDDICFLTCDGPDACEGGTVCDETTGMCVYPKPPAPPVEGEMFGPCIDNETCNGRNTCVVRTHGAIQGTICLPTCGVCDQQDVADLCGFVGPQAPACTSDDLCSVPCASQDDCLGSAVCMQGICLHTPFDI